LTLVYSGDYVLVNIDITINVVILLVYGHPNVFLSICLSQAFKFFSKKCRKTKINVNVPQGSGNQCADFYLKRTEIGRMVAQYVGTWLK